eukprot:CAMPEP_0115491574 /NCGR_PEP_ID=MMETSP0271-20121206/63181_1 /TAXON_ID=71861 /ORGANISM="Scrippsiella trochoidea, Strain CCMP3099" /LENGTH=51 /DNA_ID=CAMNT_0002919939 /DNA_START=56 /DNA_END=208 /DNA_ORIENTATION=+
MAPGPTAAAAAKMLRLVAMDERSPLFVLGHTTPWGSSLPAFRFLKLRFRLP